MRQTKATRYKMFPWKKFSLVTAITVVVLAAGYGGWAKHSGMWPFAKNASSTDYSAENGTTKNVTPKNTNTQTKSDSKATDISGDTSQQVPVDSSLAASITQLDESDGVINFATTIQNATAAGTCVVTFSNPNDRPVTKQFDSTYKAGVAACGPMTIPATEFSFLGTWSVEFHYYDSSKQATAESSITIR